MRLPWDPCSPGGARGCVPPLVPQKEPGCPSCVAVQVHGKPRHRREAAALYGGSPRGSWGCSGRAAPGACKGEASRGGGDLGTRGQSPWCGQPGLSSYGGGGGDAQGRASSQGGCGQPVQRRRGGGLVRGTPGIQPRGWWWQPEEMLAAGAAPSLAASEGVRLGGLYRGGAGSPPSPHRCVSRKVRSSCSSWELSGRWISRCMRRVSSHCSSLLKDGLSEKGGTHSSSAGPVSPRLHSGPPTSPSGPSGGTPTTHRFSGSRSQQQTAMGKKLGGQVGGQ